MKLTTALGFGAAIGAGLAIIFVPRIKKQIQETLKEATGSIERGQARVHEIAGQAIRIADQAKDKIQRVEDAVDAGVHAFQKVKNFSES